MPQPLFQTPVPNLNLGVDQYDVTGDGRRFLVLSPTNNAAQAPITVVLHWMADLEQP